MRSSSKKTCATPVLMAVLFSTGGPSSRNAVAVQVRAKTNERRYSCHKQMKQEKKIPKYYLSWHSWLETLTIVDTREQLGGASDCYGYPGKYSGTLVRGCVLDVNRVALRAVGNLEVRYVRAFEKMTCSFKHGA